MNERFDQDYRGRRGFGHRGGFGPGGPAGPGVWEAMEHLRSAFSAGFERRPSGRMGRGDVRAAVLSLLHEGPMHGYQIIQEITERSHGSWKPSPGSVYPTLQLLADEGLIEGEAVGERKTYSLTEAGKEQAEALLDKPAPWESSQPRDGARVTALPRAGMELAEVSAQVARSGSSKQVDAAVEVLEEARRKIYRILAEE